MDKRTAEVIATITEEQRLFPEVPEFWAMLHEARMARLAGRSLDDATVRSWLRGYKWGWTECEKARAS